MTCAGLRHPIPLISTATIMSALLTDRVLDIGYALLDKVRSLSLSQRYVEQLSRVFRDVFQTLLYALPYELFAVKGSGKLIWGHSRLIMQPK